MKKRLLIAALISASPFLLASEDSYYPKEIRAIIENSTQQDQLLKDTLFKVLNSAHKVEQNGTDQLVEDCPENNHNVCYEQKSLGYDKARVYLFGQIHLLNDESGTYLEDVYCNKKLRNGDFAGQLVVGPLIIPSNQFINCEHTWPQSRFSKKFAKGFQKADLHHLYPTNSRANNERGNGPFGETNAKGLNGCPASAKGASTTAGNGINYFQPPIEHRGNVARALFYFSVRYQMPIDRVQEGFLRQWHHDDPVDEQELDRNNQIEDLQWNRNPFIDFPQLVNSIKDF